MKHIHSVIQSVFALVMVLILGGCITNDIPFPIVEAKITALETENMVAPVRVNGNDHTVSVTVGDSVDITKLRLTRLLYTDAASLSFADSRYANKEKFPAKSFASLKDLPLSADTRVDLSSPLEMKLSTYQDYYWTISATQKIDRSVMMDGQVGNAVIDPVNRSVVVYVSRKYPLNALHVSEFTLGGEHGSVVPDPTDKEAYPNGFDFRDNSQFYVKHAWEATFHEWKVLVYPTDEDPSDMLSASPFARTVSASIAVKGIAEEPVVEYQKAGDTSWTKSNVTISKASVSEYIADIEHLLPASKYNYRVNNGKAVGSFTTTEAIPLPNGSLDNWHKDGKLWIPNAEGAEAFWDTGNKGATTISESNSCPTNDTWDGKGQAACLESKYLVLKFAAGNLFSGKYLRTDGTNGVLEFGKPFDAFPTKLRFRYKYRGSTINRIGDEDMEYLKGQSDIGTVYILLTDWPEPFVIKTRKSERSLLDVENDEHIIAYSKMETSETTTTYKEYTLPIDYRVKNRKPKYIVVVASSSKYGDYFVGGDSSCMWIDDMELLYE